MSYSTVLTDYGKTQLAAASDGTSVAWSTVALGDSSVTSAAEATALGNQVYSAGITALTVDDSLITVTLIVPPTDGGFTVTEAGVFDADGGMVVYATLPETYKPSSSEGSAGSLTIQLKVDVSTDAAVTLEVPAADTLATVEYVNSTVSDVTLITDLASETAGTLSDGSLGVTGVLPVEHGGTGNTAGTAAGLTTAVSLSVDLTSAEAAEFDGTASAVLGVNGVLPVASGGTGNTEGTAAGLTAAVSLITNLAFETAASFDGTADAVLGVMGVLPETYGGTGGTALSDVTVGYATMDADGNVIADTYATAAAVEELETSVASLETAVGAAQETATAAATAAATAQETADGKADTYHATTEQTYGLGTAELYGHVKLSDTADAEQAVDSGVAATPAAVAAAVDGLATTTYVDTAVDGLATTTYVDTAVDGVVTATATAATIAATGWTEGDDGYYNDVAVSGCTADLIAFVSLDDSQEAAADCGLSSTVTTGDGYVRFYADNAATEDITVTIILLEVQ